MIVGPGRFRIAKVASSGPGASNEGVVVQAVLVMALVTTIGVLLVASRVAGSRQSATAASLSNAARQAAEFGFAEIVAEMNRDSKSYLWVTKFGEWNNVRADELQKCGVGSTADAQVGLPITGSTLPIAVSGELPNPSPLKLSYQLTDYKAPEIPKGSLPASLSLSSSPQYACREDGKFGNLIGGSGEFTIVGTVKRLDGSTLSSYTLKRKVSVGRAAPIFNNPIGAIPSSRVYSVGDSRFPPSPTAPSGTYYSLDCKYYKASGALLPVNRCTADMGSLGSVVYDFLYGFVPLIIPSDYYDYFPLVRPVITEASLTSNLATLKFAAPHGIQAPQLIRVKNLPSPFNGTFAVKSSVEKKGNFALTYDLTGSDVGKTVTTGVVDLIDGKSSIKPLPNICRFNGLNVRCLVSKMTLSAKAMMLAATASNSVEIFLKGNLTIDSDSIFSGGDWTRFRIFGDASVACPADLKTNSPQVISISGSSTNGVLQSNLLNAFLWLPSGQVQYRGGDAISSRSVNVMALVGSDCTKSDFSNNPSPMLSTFSSVTNRAVLKGLGGAYGFDGLFAAGEFRVFYRGFGGAEQSLSPSR